MRRILLILAATAATWSPVLADTIFLKSGMRLDVERAWESGGKVRYRIGDSEYGFAKAEVDRVEKGNALTEKPRKKSKPIRMDSVCLTRGSYFASISKELFDQSTRLATQNDIMALQKMVDAKQVFILREGIEVFVEETDGFLGSKIRIRPKGQTFSVWTNREAVECN